MASKMMKVLASALLVSAAWSGEAAAQIRASATVDTAAPGVRIAPEVYGQFAEHLGTGIEGGIWVGPNSRIPNTRGFRNDVVQALQRLKVPVVRWPGGCFADIYHWRDGVGARAKRPVTLNKWWGNTPEDNQFGTHEFFDFAELIGAKTYLNINVGTGTAGEAKDWVEYVSSPSDSALAKARRANGRDKPWTIDYIGIGNEMWGCGGNLKAAEFSPMVRQYATFLKDANGPKIIAGGATGDDYAWTDEIVGAGKGQIDAISLHYYTLPTSNWDKKGAATGFDEAAWNATFARTRLLEDYLVGHDRAMDKHDPDGRLGLMVAEWGTWYDATPGTNSAFLQQENTLRDALVAATNFHIFHRHADRVRMANIAQMVNVLQAMILTDGPRMTLTPTYHAFMLYQPFQGAQALPVSLTSDGQFDGAVQLPGVDVTAARGTDGAVHVALVNIHTDDQADVTVNLGALQAGTIQGQVLTAAAMDARNTFDQPEAVRPAAFSGVRWQDGKLAVTMPAKSVVVLTIR